MSDVTVVGDTPYEAREPHQDAVRAPTRPRVSPRAQSAVAAFAVDASMLAAAVAMAELGSRAAGVAASPIGWRVAFACLVLALFAVRGLYAWRLNLQLVDDLRFVVTGTTFAAMAVLCLRVLVADGAAAAPQTIRLWAFAAVYVSAGRIVLHWCHSQARRDGELARPTLVVGAGRVGQLTAKRLLDHPELGLQPIGFLDKEPRANGTALPVLGASWDLDRIVARYGVRDVIVTFSTAPSDVLLRVVKRCEELGVDVFYVPRLYERMTERLTVQHVGGMPLVAARAANPKGWQFRVKYALDRVVAGIALLVLSPVLAAAALAVWRSLGRPIFFSQLRVGRDGRPFEIFKFRSMKPPATDTTRFALLDGNAPGGVEGSDRRTRVGAFLRSTSIDELPQLFNVLKGNMSLVGPRPERPEFVELFEDSVYRYGERHRVKAGITGWAQVHGLRGKTSIADRAEWDNYYIENWSLWLDFKICCMTVMAIFRSRAE